jgi:putative addiction module component (TIGR02574 family)
MDVHFGGIPMDKAALLKATDAWTINERLEFIDLLYERLSESGWTPEPEPEILAEVQRRLAEHEKDPSSVISWEEAEARLKKKK